MIIASIYYRIQYLFDWHGIYLLAVVVYDLTCR